MFSAVIVAVLRSGETESEIFTHLQIIDPQTFEAAQRLKEQRSSDYKERCVPLNTKGNSLLSGNVFCGHCGGRLIVTTNGKRYMRKDGSVTETPKTRYTCYKKTRHLGCDGQTGYTVRKLDGIIDMIVQGLFQQLSDVPKDDLLEKRYAAQLEEYKLQHKTALATHKANAAEVVQYESEVIKVIRGESKLNADLLNKLYEDAQTKAIESDLKVKSLEERIEECEEKRGSLSDQYDSMRSWADLYGDCDMETKKMILSRIMSSIRVSRDYEIEIDLTVDCEELGISC